MEKRNGKITYEELHPDIVRILKEAAKPINLKQDVRTVNLTSETDKVSIGVTINEQTDSLMVFKNSIHLTKGVDYVISDNGTKIKSLRGNWVGTVGEPVQFVFNFVRISRE